MINGGRPCLGKVPRKSLLWYNLAFACEQQGAYDEAIKACEKCLEIKSDYKDAINLLTKLT